MTKREVTQEKYEQLVEDASYIQDEAEALKYVIDTVPYDESPPDQLSVKESLQLLDHAQKNYFRPIIERVIKEKRPIYLGKFEHFEDSFSADKDLSIHKLLDKIGTHRAAILNLFNKIPLIDWEKNLYDVNNHPITLFEFAEAMIKSDRHILKKIADLVMIFENEKQTRKELENKQKN